MNDDARRLIAWRRAADPTRAISIVETHTSVLAFQGDRVYKLKKSVRFPFVDLSTAAARRAVAEREVRLNRRLAPDVYLGTVPGPAADDVVVVMRRLPADRRLAAVDSATGTTCVDAVAERLARFHAHAPTGGAVDAAATWSAVSASWHRETAELAVLPIGHGPVAAAVAAAGARYLAGREPLFTARIAAGRARDGHGDLLTDDVFCLADGPRLLDCLEFDDTLRAGDVCADVAFLAMDLEHIGRPDLARRFTAAYRAASGDTWPSSYEHFHVAARARVRAKVAALSGDEGTAASLLALAARHLDAGRIRLVVVAGPPATGKSTLARAIASVTGWPVLRSDEIRRALADGGSGPAPGAGPTLGSGIHDPGWDDRTYDEVFRRAREILGTGTSAIIDATFSDPQRRAAVDRLAATTASDAVRLRCDAPVAVCAERAARRAAVGTDVSDADASVARALAARYPQWAGATVIDTTERGDATVAALRAIGVT